MSFYILEKMFRNKQDYFNLNFSRNKDLKTLLLKENYALSYWCTTFALFLLVGFTNVT